MPNHTPRDLIYIADQALANDVTALSTQPGGSHLHERIRVTDVHARALEMIDLWDLDPAHEISRFLRGSTECVPNSPFDLECQILEQEAAIKDLDSEAAYFRSQTEDEDAEEIRENAIEAFEDAAKRIRDVIDYLAIKGSHKKKAQDMLLSVARAIEGVRL